MYMTHTQLHIHVPGTKNISKSYYLAIDIVISRRVAILILIYFPHSQLLLTIPRWYNRLNNDPKENFYRCKISDFRYVKRSFNGFAISIDLGHIFFFGKSLNNFTL